MKKSTIIIFVIIFIAFLLRLFRITEVPPSLNWDEVSIGYNAYSILKTGRDEWGKFMPVHFKSYGEYKLPAQIYASIPGIAIFGLNELGLRITPVLYGTLTVLVLFFLSKALFNSIFIGLLSSFLLAVSPWHIHLSRASFESSFSVFWILLGIWLLIKGFEKAKWLILSMIPFAISVFTYNSARIFTPLFLISTFIVHQERFIRFKRVMLLAAVSFLLLMLPLAPYLLSGERSSRYKLVSITDDPGLIPRINENRGSSNLPSPLPRLVHNKVTYTSFYFIRNYLSHFTPDFLFISGALHKQHHVQNIGQLYIFQLPFLLLGLFLLFKQKNQFRWLLVSWIMLIHIPVSVTNDSIPHALRTSAAAPFYQMITALGLYNFYLWIKGKKLSWQILSSAILCIIVLLNLANYLNNYFNIYSSKYSRDWQYGYKQVVEYLKQNHEKYDLVVFTRHYGEPHMFTLFYLNYDPAKFQNSANLVRYETHDWVWVERFDKFYFPDLGDKGTQFEDIVAQNPGKKILFIGRSGDFPNEIPRLYSVNFLNGENAFDIIEVK